MDRKRKRNSGVNEPDWTAARCQRLLRPIASRIAPLRKLAYITDLKRPERCLALQSTSDRQSSDNKSQKPSDDPIWLRRQDERSRDSRYSSKTRTIRKHKPELADVVSISLPTPFRARALRRNTPGKTPGGTKSEDCKASPCARVGNRQRKRQRKDPFNSAPVAMKSAELHDRQAFEKVFELHKGVTDGFSLLLERTQKGRDEVSAAHKTKLGARSLFSACLRCVPDYIQAEEDWRRSIDPDDETDVCAEVYEELEEMGSAKGWAPLREVVRAHGVKLINDIISEGLVSTNTRAEFSNMLLKVGESMDATRLAITFAHSLHIKRPLNQASPLFEGCLSDMKYLDLCGSQALQSTAPLQVLRSLFESGRLHISWVATKDVTYIIGQAVRRLASSDRSDLRPYTRFLGNIVKHILRLEEANSKEEGNSRSVQSIPDSLAGPLQKTVDSLLTVLTAMAIISGKEDSESHRESTQTAAALIQELTTVVMARATRNVKQKSSHQLSPIAVRFQFRILASALMIAAGQDETDDDVVNLQCDELLALIGLVTSESTSGLEAVQEMSASICDLSLCCGQSLRYNAGDILEDLISRLMTRAETSRTKYRTLLQQLSLETALKFNSVTASRQSQKLLGDLENTLQGHGTLGTGDSRLKNSSEIAAFRWEEGLCEWIAATPFVSKTKDVTITRVDRAQESPVAVSTHDTEPSAHIGAKLGQPSKGIDSLDDSGYLSMHETPQSTRRRLTIVDNLSPDELIGDMHHAPSNVSPSWSTRSISPIISRPASARSDPDREITRPVPLDRPPPAARSKSHSTWRKERLLSKYGRPSRKRQRLEGHSVVEATTSHLVDQGWPRNVDMLEDRLGCSTSEPSTTVAINESETPARRAAGNGTDNAADDNADVEFDELALSCRKKPARRSLARSTSEISSICSRASLVRGRRLTTRAVNSSAAAESEDELG